MTYTGWWEKAHRYVVKLPYLRTGRRTKRVYELLVLRVALAEAVRRKEKVLEAAKAARDQEAEQQGGVAGPGERRTAAGGEGDWDVQPERLVGRDKNGYLDVGER